MPLFERVKMLDCPDLPRRNAIVPQSHSTAHKVSATPAMVRLVYLIRSVEN